VKVLDVQYMSLHHDDNNQGSSDGPVTVIVTRKARKGKIREFEEWMDAITHEAMKFEGHMGVNIIRPSDFANPEYVIILRFNTYENLTKWEKSEIRKEWLEKSKDVTEGEPKTEIQTGLGSANKADDRESSNPVKHACRRSNYGSPNDLRDNAIYDEVIETLASQEKIILGQSLKVG
jgi:heme-degrading monooxygenase HmoA